MKYKIFDEEQHYVTVLKLFTTQHKTIIRFGLIVLLFKSLNVFDLPAITKNAITNYTFLLTHSTRRYSIIQKLVHSLERVKTTCFLLIPETRRQLQIFRL